MKILVTGGSGYLGNHVCKYFNAINYSRRNGLDLLDIKSLEKSLDDVDVIIHMACLTKGSKIDLIRNNVIGTLNLLDAISRMKKRPLFLYSSSKEVYGNNINNFDPVSEDYQTEVKEHNFYGLTKLFAEQLIISYAKEIDFRVGIFRMSTIYAPYVEGTNPGLVSRFLNMVHSGEKIYLKSNGMQVRDPLFISDLNYLFDKFIKSDIRFGIYNVGGGRENSITLLDLIHLIETNCNKKANLELDPTSSNSQFWYISDISKLEKELGWKPSVSIREGITMLI